MEMDFTTDAVEPLTAYMNLGNILKLKDMSRSKHTFSIV